MYIATHAQVSRILLDEQTKSAMGVEVKIGDKLIKVFAQKEVILSAGAINSPQILMNSGIGPKEHLESFGINVVQDLPVGKNLHDHVSFPWMTATVNQEAIQDIDVNDELYQYYTHRKGIFAANTPSNYIGLISSGVTSMEGDIEFEHVVGFKGLGIPNIWNLEDETYAPIGAGTSNTLTMLPTLLNPKSRGQVLLRSNDPFDKPHVSKGFFTDENNEDFEALYQGIQFARRMYATEVFKQYEAQILPMNVPACTGFEFDSESYYRCLMKQIAMGLYHLAGSCKMGPGEDSTSVVSDKLRVHGVMNLRVIDASVMPYAVSGNINAATVMIAEKGSDMVKDDWTD